MGRPEKISYLLGGDKLGVAILVPTNLEWYSYVVVAIWFHSAIRSVYLLNARTFSQLGDLGMRIKSLDMNRLTGRLNSAGIYTKSWWRGCSFSKLN